MKSKEITVRMVKVCYTCRQDRVKLIEALKVNSDEAKQLIKACPECKMALSSKYRLLTGECEICGQNMSEHRRCYLCGILLGEGHLDKGEKYGKRYKCGHCRKRRNK